MRAQTLEDEELKMSPPKRFKINVSHPLMQSLHLMCNDLSHVWKEYTGQYTGVSDDNWRSTHFCIHCGQNANLKVSSYRANSTCDAKKNKSYYGVFFPDVGIYIIQSEERGIDQFTGCPENVEWLD